jgi:hypothetical protein
VVATIASSAGAGEMERRAGSRVDHDARQRVQRGRQLRRGRGQHGLGAAVAGLVGQLAIARRGVDRHDRHPGNERAGDTETSLELGGAPERYAGAVRERGGHGSDRARQLLAVEPSASNLE